MGTPGYLGFVVKGKTYRCYVHYDAYESGLAKGIKLFIYYMNPEDSKTMARNLEKMEWTSGGDPPSLHMAHILPVILEGKIKRMPGGSHIMATSLAYDIDFENEILHWRGKKIAFKDIERPTQEEFMELAESYVAAGNVVPTGLEEALGSGGINVKEYWDMKPKYEELCVASKEQWRKMGQPAWLQEQMTQEHLVARGMFWLEQYPVPDGWVVKNNRVLRSTEEATETAAKGAADDGGAGSWT